MDGVFARIPFFSPEGVASPVVLLFIFFVFFIFLHTSGTRGVLVALHMAARIYWGEGIKR